MKRLLAVFVLTGASLNAQTITQTFGSGINQFSIEFVTIGNPNNSADTTGSPNPVGSVSHLYNIGKYEVSRDMIHKANSLSGINITLQDMSSGFGTAFGGNGANRPATGISWNEAARFVNWLNTSKGYQAAYNFDANGNFQLWNTGQYSGNNQYRHKNAYFFLPSTDEWYKAAYGSPLGAWYDFSTGADSQPTAVASGASADTAVYGQSSTVGPADIDSAGGLSPYGTMAQGGNVHEWIETAFDGVNDDPSEYRDLRGGSYIDAGFKLRGTYRNTFVNPSSEDSTNFALGVRIASVPEPSSLSLLLAGGAVLMVARRRNS